MSFPSKILTMEALSVAYAAYRINNSSLKFTNLDLVDYYFRHRDGRYIDPEFEMFEPTAQDYANAKAADEYIKKYFGFELLSGNISLPHKLVLKCVIEDVLRPNTLLTISQIPARLNTPEIQAKMFKKQPTSQHKHIGKVGESVSGRAVITMSTYFEQWKTYNYVAKIGEDTISFMYKKPLLNGAKVKVKGRVKDLTTSPHTQTPETRLHQVKVYEK